MDDIAPPMEEPLSNASGSAVAGGDFADVLSALGSLDRLLERAVIAATSAYGAQAADDRFRGLHISTPEVERLLAQAPGTSPLWSALETGGGQSARNDRGSRVSWLADVFGLSRLETDMVLIALAPEVDLRYERLYAFLQDDVSRRRPSVDLVLNLLCSSAEAKLAARGCFSSESPLIRHRLIHLVPDVHHVQPPLLAHQVKLDGQIVRLLLHEPGIDARLKSFCRFVNPALPCAEVAVQDGTRQALRALVARARRTRQPLRLYFHGPHGTGKRRCAELLSSDAAAPLLAVDLARVPANETDLDTAIRLVLREAWFQDAIVYLEGIDALRADPRPIAFDGVLDALAEDGGVAIMAGTARWSGSDRRSTKVITVQFGLPDFGSRQSIWSANLRDRGVSADTRTIDALSDRFRFSAVQIAEAVSQACSRAELRACSGAASAATVDGDPALAAAPSATDLFAAARTQCGDALAALAHKIEPRYGWEDLVLPADALAQLHEICQRVAQRHRVLNEWGFDRKLSLGKGVNALFAGPSGTGKTMAAEIIAHTLELDLYRIDLAGVISKYIGETEKNLDRVFSAAGSANAILFFDEADALFGKRSEVRDSHDRYANIEISYLLQKMEEYDGIAILATNVRQHLDDAFMRRLAFTVHFPFPDEASRRRIWEGIWPAETPLDSDADLDRMARQFKLSGGNIKNVALASAFLAAEDQTCITMAHLIQATRREHQKIGKTLSDLELDGFGQEPQRVARLSR
jgi:SpoVK/Ycf46/Vps4 family AAA+-type ATPase